MLVLDDYHVIRNPACHASVEALTAHPISQARPVVSTRADPPIPLGRLPASGSSGGDPERPGLYPAETAELLNGTMGLGPSGGELETLQGRTQGWSAGLQLRLWMSVPRARSVTPLSRRARRSGNRLISPRRPAAVSFSPEHHAPIASQGWHRLSPGFT